MKTLSKSILRAMITKHEAKRNYKSIWLARVIKHECRDGKQMYLGQIYGILKRPRAISDPNEKIPINKFLAFSRMRSTGRFRVQTPAISSYREQRASRGTAELRAVEECRSRDTRQTLNQVDRSGLRYIP